MTSIPRTRPALAAMFIALLALSLAAISIARAAEPSEGAISKASPKIEWTGVMASSGVTAEAWNRGYTDTPCESPTCDPFTLLVSDAGAGVNLVIKTRLQDTAAQGNNGNMTLRITDPAGKVTVYTGESGPDTDLKTTIKNAANGKYQIDSAASYVCCGESTHISTAELVGPGIGGGSAPAPGGTTPAPAPAPGTAPGPQAAPETKLSIKPGKTSARKVKKTRKVLATLTTSAPLTDVNVVLESARKRFATLKLASLEGKKKITLKLVKRAKLKKGKYQLSAGGKDAQGRSVVAVVRLTVKK